MEIRIKIREISTVTMKSKDALVRIVGGYGFPALSPYGSYLTPYGIGMGEAIVANYQLVRGKTKQTKDKKGNTKSVVIRKKAWTVRIFSIPIEVLRVANLKVEQKPRYFEFTKRR